MAASSPYSGNDYQAISNFRPYELPINEIAKASVAIDEFWKAGARKVKSYYDNALNLDLTLDANKQVKKEFMDQAEKQLTKLSSMDLSDPSVQRQGFNIYKPLLNDKAIMYDNQLTKTLKSIYTDAEGYKRRKLSSTGAEGEGYTQRNLAYSLDGFENFNKDLPRDPALLEELYGKLGKRKFTPYYNPTKEYASILKNCKGSGGEKQDVASNYMYFDNFSKTGANSSETSNCFMMGLSEKAKEQMGVDGWAYYKANPDLLVADHQQFAYGRQETQLKAVQGKISAIKAGGISESERAQLKELEDMVPALQAEVDNRKKEYNEMVGGNAMNYVTQNFQTLAKGIYLNKNYAALGEAFKSDETSRKLTANAAGIAQFNAIERAQQNELDRAADRENIILRAILSRKLKQEAGEIPMDFVDVITPVATEDTPANQYNESSYRSELSTARGALDRAYQTLTSYILSKDPNTEKSDFTHAFILNWADQHSKKPVEQQDKQFRELMEAYNTTKENFSNLDIRGKAVYATAENQIGIKGKSYDVGGTKFTFDELSALRRGQTVKGVHYVPGQQINSGMGTIYREGFYANDKGVIYQDDPYTKETENIQKTIDKLFNDDYYSTNPYATPRLDPKKNPGVDARIKTTLGVSGDSNEKNGYRLFGHDPSGKDLYVIPLDDEGNEINMTTDDSEYAKAYRRNPAVQLKSIGGKNVVVIPNVLPALPDTPTTEQQSHISSIRSFQSLMGTMLKSKTGYYSSEDLKNRDGTTFAYPNVMFKTPFGANVKVKAVQMNGQTKLVPAVERKDGSWDDNYQSFTTPEELVLYFRTHR